MTQQCVGFYAIWTLYYLSIEIKTICQKIGLKKRKNIDNKASRIGE